MEGFRSIYLMLLALQVYAGSWIRLHQRSSTEDLIVQATTLGETPKCNFRDRKANLYIFSENETIVYRYECNSCPGITDDLNSVCRLVETLQSFDTSSTQNATTCFSMSVFRGIDNDYMNNQLSMKRSDDFRSFASTFDTELLAPCIPSVAPQMVVQFFFDQNDFDCSNTIQWIALRRVYPTCSQFTPGVFIVNNLRCSSGDCQPIYCVDSSESWSPVATSCANSELQFVIDQLPSLNRTGQSGLIPSPSMSRHGTVSTTWTSTVSATTSLVDASRGTSNRDQQQTDSTEKIGGIPVLGFGILVTVLILVVCVLVILLLALMQRNSVKRKQSTACKSTSVDIERRLPPPRSKSMASRNKVLSPSRAADGPVTHFVESMDEATIHGDPITGLMKQRPPTVARPPTPVASEHHDTTSGSYETAMEGSCTIPSSRNSAFIFGEMVDIPTPRHFHHAVRRYASSDPSELEFEIEDPILITSPWENGVAQAKNDITGQKGFIKMQTMLEFVDHD